MRARLNASVLVAAVVMAAALGMAFGGRESAPSAAERAAPDSAVELLRQTSSFEYAPYAGPAEMLDHSAIAVVGRIHHLETAIVRDEIDGRGVLIVAIDPTEWWKGNAQVREGPVHFVLPRPKNLGIEAYEKAMPIGAEIVLFGAVHPPSTNFVSGDPGTTTYVPDPQGLFFLAHQGSSIENVWASEAANEWGVIDDLDSLRKATLGG